MLQACGVFFSESRDGDSWRSLLRHDKTRECSVGFSRPLPDRSVPERFPSRRERRPSGLSLIRRTRSVLAQIGILHFVQPPTRTSPWRNSVWGASARPSLRATPAGAARGMCAAPSGSRGRTGLTQGSPPWTTKLRTRTPPTVTAPVTPTVRPWRCKDTCRSSNRYGWYQFWLFLTCHLQDCNNDGKIDCDDFAAIHKLGGYGCKGGLPGVYGQRYQQCKSLVSATGN